MYTWPELSSSNEAQNAAIWDDPVPIILPTRGTLMVA